MHKASGLDIEMSARSLYVRWFCGGSKDRTTV